MAPTRAPTLDRRLGRHRKEARARTGRQFRERCGSQRGVPLLRLDRLTPSQDRRPPQRTAVHATQTRQRLVQGQQGPPRPAARRRTRRPGRTGGHRTCEAGRQLEPSRQRRSTHRLRRPRRRTRRPPNCTSELRRLPTIRAPRASSSGSAPPRPRQRERSASRRQHSSHSTTSEPTNGPDNDHRPSRANTSPTVFGCIHPILTVSMPSPKLGWNCAPEGRNRRRNARGQPRATLSAGMCSRPHRAARSAELSTRCQRRADPRARTGAYGIDAFEARERA